MHLTPVILLADPDAHTHETLARELRAAGWDTLHARTDMECIDLALKHMPDVLVLAVCSPELHGIHIAHALRGVPEFRNVQLVALATGRDCIRYRAALEADFRHVVVKPLVPGEVGALLRESLDLEEPAVAAR